MGCMCAAYLAKKEKHIRPPSCTNNIFGILGITLIVSATFGFTRETPTPSHYTLIPTLGTALIIIFGQERSIVAQFLSVRPLVSIGLISYSAYLWHHPLLVFARLRFSDSQFIWAFPSILTLTFAIALFSYHFIEKPFRRPSQRALNTRVILTIAGTMIVIFAIVGAVIKFNDGLPARYKSTKLENTISTMVFSPKRSQCHSVAAFKADPQTSCRYFSENPTWAVFGDSHAVELSYAMAKKLESSNDGIVHLSRSACGPQNGINDMSNCAKWTKSATTYLINDSEIKNIVVSYRIASYLFGGHERVYPDLPSSSTEDQRQEIWTSLVNILRQFDAAGKNVFYVLQAPEVKAIIERQISQMDKKGNAVSVPKSWWNNRIQYVTDRIGDLPQNVKVINPASQFCDQKYCYAIKDYQSLYFDDDHMSVTGATIVADMILNKSTKARNKSDNQNPIRP